MSLKSVDQSALNDENKAIVQFIEKSGPTDFDVLFAAFGEPLDNRETRNRFRARLSRLVHGDHLATSVVASSSRVWRLGIKYEAPAESVASQPAQRAPRRNYALMTPRDLPRMTALRPGADEFVAAPSLRNGQRLPFTGGYVAAGSKA